MKSLLAALAFVLAPALANAGKVKVIYFGGYGAGAAQMKCWENGAAKQARARGYVFKGIPYPKGASWTRDSALSVGASTIRAVVREISNHPKQAYVIVGHSSGAALSNRVAELAQNPGRIELVDLDGFSPSHWLQRRVPTTCMYAVNRANRLTSNNASSIRANCGSNARAYQNQTCRTRWCLHFSLANKSAPADLGGGADFKRRGYQGCNTNIDWLERL